MAKVERSYENDIVILYIIHWHLKTSMCRVLPLSSVTVIMDSNMFALNISLGGAGGNVAVM